MYYVVNQLIKRLIGFYVPQESLKERQNETSLRNHVYPSRALNNTNKEEGIDLGEYVDASVEPEAGAPVCVHVSCTLEELVTLGLR